MTSTRLIAHETRYELLSLVRNRQSMFFSVIMPILFLVIFVATFGNNTETINGHEIKLSTFYVPSLAAMGIISATFVSLGISATIQRESGVLKRRRATPISAMMIIIGRCTAAVCLAILIVVLLVAIGKIAYGVRVPISTMPALIVTVMLGSVCFCSLGYVVASLVASADSAPAVIQSIILPLYFFSGVFIPDSSLPMILKNIANFFPVSHLAKALLATFDPSTTGSGFSWIDLAVLAAWGAAGLILAMRRFSWIPKTT